MIFVALFALTFGAFVNARANDARILMEREDGRVDAQIEELDKERLNAYDIMNWMGIPIWYWPGK